MLGILKINIEVDGGNTTFDYTNKISYGKLAIRELYYKWQYQNNY
jgi:hypothetical protein